MKLTTFDEAIDFAIKREEEAVAFYIELQDLAKFSAQKKVLKEFQQLVAEESKHKNHFEVLSERL